MKDSFINDNIQVYYIHDIPVPEKTIDVHPKHYEISYCLDGELDFQISDKEFILSKSKMLVIPKTIEHSYWNAVDNEMCSIMFTDTFLEKSVIEKYYNFTLFNPDEPSFYDFSNNPFFRNSVEHVIKQMIHGRNDDPVSCLRIKNYLVELLLLLYEFDTIDAKGTTKRSEISSVVEYIQKNYFMNIDLSILSSQFDVSYSYLGKLFKKETSMSFKEYLNRIRLDKCAELLVQSDKPIVSICFECGFNDLVHFYKMFKNQFNKTPQQYRKKGLVEKKENTLYPRNVFDA